MSKLDTEPYPTLSRKHMAIIPTFLENFMKEIQKLKIQNHVAVGAKIPALWEAIV